MTSEMDRLKELAGPIVRDHMSHMLHMSVHCTVCVCMYCALCLHLCMTLCPVDQFVCAIGKASPLNYVHVRLL